MTAPPGLPSLASMRRQIHLHVAEIVAEKTFCEPAQVTPDIRFQEDLGVDSLKAIEIIAAVASRFDIEIEEDDFLGLESIDDLERMITAKIGDRGWVARRLGRRARRLTDRG